MATIGQLRHRVDIQRLSSGAQNMQTGDITREWQSLRMAWASIDALSGHAYMAAQAAQSQVTSRITIRKTDVLAKDRIVHNGRIYNIEAVLPDNKGGNTYLTLMVSSGVNNG